MPNRARSVSQWSGRIPAALLAFALSAVTTSAIAAEAAFSTDGNFVYFFKLWDSAKPNEPVELTELDLATRRLRALDLSKLKPPGGFIAIDRSADGLLLLTGRTLYSFDPKTGASATICEAPEDEGFEDVASDPKSGNILITGFVKRDSSATVGWYYLKGEKRLLLITSRRVPAIESPTFAPDGLLFFGARGDLWAGRLEVDSQTGSEPPELAFLEAVRVAPVADLETGDFTPAAEGVRGVAVARDAIYVITYRMGGSGHGHLLRLPPLAAPFKTLTDFPATISLYGRLLGGAKVLEAANYQRMPCASPTGDRVFFGGSGRELFLLRVANDQREVVADFP